MRGECHRRGTHTVHQRPDAPLRPGGELEARVSLSTNTRGFGEEYGGQVSSNTLCGMFGHVVFGQEESTGGDQEPAVDVCHGTGVGGG